MQLDAGFVFPVDESFNMGSQSFACPSTTGSFSAPSSAYEPFTPTSRRSTPADIKLELDEACITYAGELSPTHGASGNYIFGPAKMEEPMSFTEALPSTPLRRMNSYSSVQGNMMAMNLANQMDVMTPSNSFNMYNLSPQNLGNTQAALMMTPTRSLAGSDMSEQMMLHSVPGPFMMTPSHSMSGSDLAEGSQWSDVHDSPNQFFSQGHMVADMSRNHMGNENYMRLNPNMNVFGAGDISPEARTRRMMVEGARHRTEALQQAQRERAMQRAQHKVEYRRRTTMPTEEDDSNFGNGEYKVVKKSKCKCDYPGCTKAFQRNEHLKRHKQTTHGEGPNRFECEFCGKNQFNRQDNLNNHRKLHARPNSRNRGVEFIPAAVAIIEKEERSRKKRQPPRSKTDVVAWDEFEDSC